jgi:hypothetical protein
MTAYRSVGNWEVFESGSEALTVTKTAQALKLRHPTNRTNLMAVLLPPTDPSSLTHGCDRSSRNQEECTMYTTLSPARFRSAGYGGTRAARM